MTPTATLRAFNRAYTARLGLLAPRLDASPFTLSEARVLYELAHRVAPTAADLARALRLDRAQLSRTLARFTARGLVTTGTPRGREQPLALTAAGRDAFAALDAGTEAAVSAFLDALPPLRRGRLLAAASTITAALADAPAAFTLRPLRPGDLGWIVHRQAVLYFEEYGWNADYEAMIVRILADFHAGYDPARDAGWIAEQDGAPIGSIFLVRGDAPAVAKLRLLYVEPAARGSGTGARLIDACIAGARERGYARLDLWTNSVLTAARRLYERAGFRLVAEKAHHSFGHALVGQTWSLDLTPSVAP